MLINRAPLQMRYEQFGDVALIILDGRAVAVAKFVDGAWECDYYEQENESRRSRRDIAHRQPTLDDLVFEIHCRGRGDWIGRDTMREPADPEEWARVNGDR